MGVLTDDGAEALLSGQPLGHLRELDLQHHFLTDPMVARLRAALPQVRLLIDQAQKDHDPEWRYVAVSE
jgi:membrane-bound lytic murein transglycosylase MltF